MVSKAKSQVRSDKEIIMDDDWADCWICATVFRRRRQTQRYCGSPTCERGACEGEHGSFSSGRLFLCVACQLRSNMKTKR